MLVKQPTQNIEDNEISLNTSFVDKHSVAERFSSAADNYDLHANVQKQIAKVNIQLLLDRAKQPATMSIDLGCGTASYTKYIAALSEQCVAIDISHGMLKTAKANITNSAKSPNKTVTLNSNESIKTNIQFCLGDADSLPLLDASVDVFHSSMTLQWSSSPETCLSEISRVLANEGVAQLAIMLDSSMHELRDAWQSIGVESRVNRFFSRTQWLDAMQSVSSRCIDTLIEFEYQTQGFQEWHAGSLQMLRALKKVGAATKQGSHVVESSCPIPLRKKMGVSTISKRELSRVDERMTQQESGYPLSYDVLFLSIKKTKM